MSSAGEGEVHSSASESIDQEPVARKRTQPMKGTDDAPRSASKGFFSQSNPDFAPQHATIGKEARELYFEGFAISADNFASVAAKFGVLTLFYQFMEAPPVRLTEEEKLDQIVSCISVRGTDTPVWRRCKIDISLAQAVVRIHDVDANLSFVLILRNDQGPSTSREALSYLQGVDLGEGKPTLESMMYPVTVYVQGKSVPITILFSNSRKQSDFAKCLCLLTSYRALLDREVQYQDNNEQILKRVCRVSSMEEEARFGAARPEPRGQERAPYPPPKYSPKNRNTNRVRFLRCKFDPVHIV